MPALTNYLLVLFPLVSLAISLALPNGGPIFSYLRRTLYREKMVERVPSDTVINTPGVEYIAGVGARYMENLIHHARQIKSDDVNLAEAVELLGKIEDDQSRIEAVDDLIFSMAVPSHEDSISTPTPCAQTPSVEDQNEVEPEALADEQDPNRSIGLMFAHSASKDIDIINEKEDEVSSSSTISPDEFEVYKTKVIASWE